MSNQTPSQTVGPFFHYGLIFAGENDLLNEETKGQHILIKGKVIDGDGTVVPDAMIETWQADAQGVYNHPADPKHAKADPNFGGFARAATNDDGIYEIKTVKPGAVSWDGEKDQAPHINVRVFARGMLIHAYTRMYFSDEKTNQDDPVLNLEGVAGRKDTLIANYEEIGGGPAYRFDIRLQGDQETVFFNP
jgi:protocatechuate 3,4-dioxygenase alpha subunit